MFNRLAQAFSSIFDRFKGVNRLDATTKSELLSMVRDALLDADVPYEAVNAFVARLDEDLMLGKTTIPANEYVSSVVFDSLVSFLGGKNEASFPSKIPGVVLVVGLQGAGKTTTIGKLARWLKAHKSVQRILVASVDYCRPAAREQLKQLANQVNVDYYESSLGAPIDAAHDIYAYYRSQKYDMLMLDTAGQLHIDQAMIDEVQAVQQAVQADDTILVLDGMTGQDSLAIAEHFHRHVPCTGGIVTKLDSQARGGAAFAFRQVTQKPVLFMGTGEKSDAIEPFHAERIARRMLDMGDLLTLVESAQQKIRHEEQEAMYRKLKQGDITLDDFAKQLDMVQNLGSMQSIMKYMPGASQMKISDEQIASQEKELKKFRVIINSMTKKERLLPKVINGSRKRRIANGAGVSVQEVAGVLKRFEESKQLLKQIKKMPFASQLFGH